MKKINRVIIFTEGGDNIGFGHITRCSALYEEIESRDIEVLFVIFGKNIDDLLKGKRYLNKDWKDREFLKFFLKEDDYIIIDSYLADIETYKFISESTKKCLYIDDNNRISYPKGIVLNPVLYDEVVYKTENIVLQGKDYIILRKEFLETTTDTVEKNIDVLITLGGTDIRNLTPKLLQIIKRINSKLKIAVVIGKAFDNIEKIEKEKNDNIEFYYNLNALEMKEIILKSRNIICGCGQSINELLYLKANFFPIVIADNQEKNAAFLYKNKIAGEVLRADRSFCEIESIRFENILKSTLKEQKEIREWRNDPKVRKFMYNSEIINEEQHLKWIDSLKKSENIDVFFIIYAEQKIGIVSVKKISTKIYNWGIYLNNSLEKGKGIGREIGEKFLKFLFTNYEELEIIEYDVISENLISLNLALGLGMKKYKEEKNLTINNKKMNVTYLKITKQDWRKYEKNKNNS